MNTNPHEVKVQLLEGELQQLRQVVLQLQADRAKDQENIKNLQEELSVCVSCMAAASRESYTQDQLEQWAREQVALADNLPADYLPLNAFIGELESLAKKHEKR